MVILLGRNPFDHLHQIRGEKFYNRDVAQFGRALRSGRRGRRFKSCRIDFMVREYRKLDGLPIFFYYKINVAGEAGVSMHQPVMTTT